MACPRSSVSTRECASAATGLLCLVLQEMVGPSWELSCCFSDMVLMINDDDDDDDDNDNDCAK